MNIYIDGTIYSLQKGGGITRYTNELIYNYIKLGHEVTLIVHPKTFNKKTVNDKLKIIEVPSILRIDNKLLRFLTYPFHKMKLESYFKKHKFGDGIYHSTYFTHYKNIDIPQVLTMHDLTREKFPTYFNKISDKVFLLITKKSISKSSAIICDSMHTLNDLMLYYPETSPDKIHVTHLGVNPSFKTETDKKKKDFLSLKNISKPYILFVGRRSTYKNFEKFAEAYSNWKHKENFPLVVVGGGKFTEIESKFIEKLGLKKDIINFDFVSEEELVMFYNCAHSFIFPSLSEGFGLPLLEAMACSTQVLASDILVFREIAEDIPCYFNPLNTESIIKALDGSLVKDPSRIMAGVDLVKKFTWENTAKETLKIYEKILNQNSL